MSQKSSEVTIGGGNAASSRPYQGVGQYHRKNMMSTFSQSNLAAVIHASSAAKSFNSTQHLRQNTNSGISQDHRPKPSLIPDSTSQPAQDNLS